MLIGRGRDLWVDAVLVLVLAALTVNRYAPSAFSGDVILYPVMSLQNVTLFFWEQNRLLNVGPALTSVLRDPVANFFANLIFPALVFFVLLRYVAGLAVVRPTHAATEGAALSARAVFLLLALAVFLVLRPVAIFDYVIWHVEYSLSWLLLALAYFFWFVRDSAWSAKGALLLAGLVLVATGVNYSIVLPAGALVCWRVWVTKSLTRDTVIFAGVGLGAFLLWALIARFYTGPGQGAYAGFDPFGLGEALPRVLHNLAEVMFLPGLALVFCVVMALRLAGRRRQRAGGALGGGAGVRGALILFALTWLVFFAGNSWVAANHYHFRYFAPVLFVGLIVLALELARVLRPLAGHTLRLPASALLTLLGVLLLAHLLRPFVPLHQYEFARRVEAVRVEGVTLYGGDFNVAWAAVMRDLLRGEPALGIAERASGNEAALHAHAAAVLAAEGVLRVNCLDAEVTRCVDQANAYIGPLRLREVAVEGRGGRYRVLTLEPGPQEALVYRGAALAALQGEVGLRDSKGVTAGAERGFLVYGPYRPMAAGTYRLRVFGTASDLADAWVDVVSKNARHQHVRLPLSAAAGWDGELLAEGVLRLEVPVRDLEVRVFVSPRDRLVLTGYKLMPDAEVMD